MQADSRWKVFGGKRVLITGGLGFIGSTLAHRLAGLGARVLLVDSLIPEYGGNQFNIDGLEDSVQVNISDVRDEHSFRLPGAEPGLPVQPGRTDQPPGFDGAIRSPISRSTAARSSPFWRRAASTIPALRIVFASTRQIYGKPDYLPVDEKHLLRPVDVNGVNKMAGEWFHILYNNVYGICACALRLGNTYGPRMRVKDARQTFLGIWIRLLLEGKPFEVWDGHQLRDFTYVDDAVEAFLLAAADDRTSAAASSTWAAMARSASKSWAICWWRRPGSGELHRAVVSGGAQAHRYRRLLRRRQRHSRSARLGSAHRSSRGPWRYPGLLPGALTAVPVEIGIPNDCLNGSQFV